MKNKKHHGVMPLIDWGRPNPYLQYSIERPLMSIRAAALFVLDIIYNIYINNVRKNHQLRANL